MRSCWIVDLVSIPFFSSYWYYAPQSTAYVVEKFTLILPLNLTYPLAAQTVYLNQNPVTLCHSDRHMAIRRRSDYIIGFITPAIGPNKSKELTRLIAPAHNKRGKVWMQYNVALQTDSYRLWSPGVKPCIHSNFAAYIECRRYKPCEFSGFVWTDCCGNKSYYAITSPANRNDRYLSLYTEQLTYSPNRRIMTKVDLTDRAWCIQNYKRETNVVD